MKDIRLIAFTEKGYALANQLAELLNGVVSRCSSDVSLPEWTKRAFAQADALIYVGAAGIAVRAIAPYIQSKATDPAVVVVDERGQFVISLLSGHLGGANALTRSIAALINAVPVITTATDVNGVFAVDEWARCQGFAVSNPQSIKHISARLLSGKKITIASDWEISGTPPETVLLSNSCGDVRLSLTETSQACLHLVPRITVLGIGCKRNTPAKDLEAAVCSLLQEKKISPRSVCKICSINLKQDEKGLNELCAQLHVPLETYSSEQLSKVEGTFSASSFVQSITGVDNVCERSALLGSDGGTLWCKKTVFRNVTIAMALKPFRPTWRWQSE